MQKSRYDFETRTYITARSLNTPASLCNETGKVCPQIIEKVINKNVTQNRVATNGECISPADEKK